MWGGGELVVLDNGGRTVWDVFNDENMIGNTRVSLCSRVLKSEPLRAWIDEHCDPGDTTIYLGFDWTEEHRLERSRPHWEPWLIEAPLCSAPYLTKWQILDELRDAGLQVPKLYQQGFPHNNCGGACVKAGHASWKRLLQHDPERFAAEEAQEQAFRERSGFDVSILRDRTGGETKPLTLRKFREGLTAVAEPSFFDGDDWGACACFDEGGNQA